MEFLWNIAVAAPHHHASSKELAAWTISTNLLRHRVPEAANMERKLPRAARVRVGPSIHSVPRQMRPW